jgi:hypothetical protein
MPGSVHTHEDAGNESSYEGGGVNSSPEEADSSPPWAAWKARGEAGKEEGRRMEESPAGMRVLVRGREKC